MADEAYVSRSMPWGLLVALGIALVILGLAMVVFPVVSTFAIGITLGWLLLVSGVIQVIASFWALGRNNAQFWLLLLRGLLFGIAGYLLIGRPLAAVLTLTLVVGVLFVIEGIVRIVESFALPAGRAWYWIGGIVSILLGGFILFGFPEIALAALGVIVGVWLLFYGFTIVFAGFAIRSYEAHGGYRPTAV